MSQYVKWVSDQFSDQSYLEQLQDALRTELSAAVLHPRTFCTRTFWPQLYTPRTFWPRKIFRVDVFAISNFFCNLTYSQPDMCQFHLVNSTSNLLIPIPRLFLPNTFYQEQVLRVPTWNTYSEQFMFQVGLSWKKYFYPLCTFTTLLGSKPITYDKFTKSLKWLLNSQVWGQAIVVTGLGEEGYVLAPDSHSR